ncbi:MAG: signal recognition particle protein [Rhodopirellula sp.]|nr:signal recognition particle protein [Rhodopirellula sp.]
MFEGITDNLKSALSFMNRGRLTETSIREGMKTVRQALLEADVNYDVAQSFVERVTERAVGDSVLKSLSPTEQIVGIVNQELIDLMGPVDHSLHFVKGSVTILMMCGLQGAGKTTTCGKLARLLLAEGRKPLLVAADLQRPAAIEQLRVVGEQVGVSVYTEDPAASTPLKVCQNGVAQAKKEGADVVILDTAGRLHVDDELMNELEQIDRRVQPHQILLVCDAMTGQDAVNSAKVFNEALELDGVILTKLDGDTRGGAALSVKEVTGVPIKFIGVGEQLDKLELFHPDRMASRILGMGDVVTLFEKAQQEITEEEMADAQQKMSEGKFTLVDFQKQMRMVKRMGSVKDIMKMIPGLGGMADKLGAAGEDPEKELKRVDGIINSMTEYEREHPSKIDRSRRNRIASGCGVEPAEVNALLKQFGEMATMMKRMSGMGAMDRMRAVQDIARNSDPSGNFKVQKQRSKRGPQSSDKLKDLKKKQRQDKKKSRKRNK